MTFKRAGGHTSMVLRARRCSHYSFASISLYGSDHLSGPHLLFPHQQKGITSSSLRDESSLIFTFSSEIFLRVELLWCNIIWWKRLKRTGFHSCKQRLVKQQPSKRKQNMPKPAQEIYNYLAMGMSPALCQAPPYFALASQASGSLPGE